MKIAIGRSRTDTSWLTKDITWEQFLKRLNQITVTRYTLAEFKALDKKKQSAIKDVGGFVGGALKGPSRNGSEVVSRSMLTIDVDSCDADALAAIIASLDVKCVIYSTYKYTPENPRCRLVVKLTREISGEEYGAVSRMFVSGLMDINAVDHRSFYPEQMMFWRAAPKDVQPFYKEVNGPELDPDLVLARYKNWRNRDEWPRTKQESRLHDSALKAGDPFSKPFPVGEFNRAYSIYDVLDTFLSDVYEPTDDPTRYSYKAAHSEAGAVVYEDKWLYSYHANKDPAAEKLLNAFDLVRVHKFGALDADAPAGTNISKMPSYKAMYDFVRSDINVKKLIAAEKMQSAQQDFAEAAAAEEPQDLAWTKDLLINKQGSTANCLHNLRLILDNDIYLKKLRVNELAQCIEVCGRLPWRHEGKFWRDADYSQLVMYVDANYGEFSQRNYEIAVDAVTDSRRYHPIKQYLQNLPEWDGVPRVDSLLIDYLGAEDNAYVRAVTRKTLCAAVRRVYEPGCKFDTMLVLNGPQGIGKSTLIARLAREWFSDNLSLADTRDKTAAEKLQGYWILEIGELAGLKKMEVETLRSFLSRQNDIYRAAYGRTTAQHPRQCIFFGTTNAESGYLRDVNGNRRFWPVRTPGGGRLASWGLTPETVAQIWAEVKIYERSGEELFIKDEVAEMALKEQQQAMESDDREGLVKEYLDTLLPENWQKMSVQERRDYLLSDDELKAKGAIKRTEVSRMEIWCECLGQDKSSMRSQIDGTAITAILIKLGWVLQPKMKRLKWYGKQRIFAEKNRGTR